MITHILTIFPILPMTPNSAIAKVSKFFLHVYSFNEIHVRTILSLINVKSYRYGRNTFDAKESVLIAA